MSNISEFEPYLPENIEIVKTDDETIWAEKNDYRTPRQHCYHNFSGNDTGCCQYGY